MQLIFFIAVSYYLAQFGLKLTILPKVVLNSIFLLSLLSSRITDLHCHTQTSLILL